MELYIKTTFWLFLMVSLLNCLTLPAYPKDQKGWLWVAIVLDGLLAIWAANVLGWL